MKTVAVLTLVTVGFAGLAQAQTAPTQMQVQPEQAQATTGPTGNFRDECGFLYNSRGDRIDARGRILPPPRSVGPPCRGKARY